MKVLCILAAIIISCQCNFDSTMSFSDSLSSAEISAEISLEDMSALLSAELPPACNKIPQAFTPNLKRLGGFWYKAAGLPFGVTPDYPCETMLNIYNSHDNSLHTTAQHFINNTSPRTTDWQVTIRIREGVPHVTDTVPPNVAMPYWRVLDTDYATYAIIYACVDVYDTYAGTIIWIVSRYRRYRPEVMIKAEIKLRQMGIVRNDWHYNKSKFC